MHGSNKLNKGMEHPKLDPTTKLKSG